jgi:hypothetical protein
MGTDGSLHEAKWSGHEWDDLPPASVEVKKIYSPILSGGKAAGAWSCLLSAN